jgi:hypothetical protein
MEGEKTLILYVFFTLMIPTAGITNTMFKTGYHWWLA